MQNNVFKNTRINRRTIQLLIADTNEMEITVANNYYENMEITKENAILYVYSELSDVHITNETLKYNTLDDLHTIGGANNVRIVDFTVLNNTNTPAITEQSAIIRILKANNEVSIENFLIDYSLFSYGKAIEIESAKSLIISKCYYHENKLENANFFVFNSIQKSSISDVVFENFKKESDKMRYAISMPTLILSEGYSEYTFQDITFNFSESSFLNVEQVKLVNSADSSAYTLTIQDCYM